MSTQLSLSSSKPLDLANTQIASKSVTFRDRLEELPLPTVLLAIVKEYIVENLEEALEYRDITYIKNHKSTEPVLAAFFRAAQLGDIELVQTFLEGRVNVNHWGESGGNAVYHAAEGDHGGVVRLLLKNKFDLTRTYGVGGSTEIMIASKNNRLSSLKEMVVSRVGLDYQDGGGDTALMLAAEKGNTEAVKILLGARADIALQDSKGKTAIFHAIFNPALMEILVAPKIGLDLKDKIKRTALDEAFMHGETESVKVLLKAGASLDLQTKQSKLSLAFTDEENQQEILALVEENSKIEVEKDEEKTQ